MSELAFGSNLTERTLCIYMTRGEHKVREVIDGMFGKFDYIAIDVDGERHRYDADSIIALLESLEVDDGKVSVDNLTPEQAIAATLGSEREKALEERIGALESENAKLREADAVNDLASSYVAVKADRDACRALAESHMAENDALYMANVKLESRAAELESLVRDMHFAMRMGSMSDERDEFRKKLGDVVSHAQDIAKLKEEEWWRGR